MSFIDALCEEVKAEMRAIKADYPDAFKTMPALPNGAKPEKSTDNKSVDTR
jgi:hypothetical protein